jgi:Putative lumazine-binding
MAGRLIVAAGCFLSAILPAGAQSPTTAGAAAAPARVSVAQFRDAQWLEGTWRGRMSNGKYFYERYTRVNDSTIQVLHFPDSTLAASNETDSITLRDGVVRHGRAVALRFDAQGIDFAAPPRATPQFTFTPAAGGRWTATIQPANQGAQPIVYQMERYTAPSIQPVNDREAVRRAVLDYVEGFYEGDTTKLMRSVWPQVLKYGYARNASLGTYRGMQMAFPAGFRSYVDGVKTGRNQTPPNAPKTITIFDVQDQTASAKLTAFWGTDYLLLAKENGRWMITHVLWQTPQPAR